MFWLIVLLLLLALVLFGLANQMKVANRAVQVEKEIIAFAAGLRRRNQSYAKISDAELVVAVKERMKSHQRPVFLLLLGSGLMIAITIAIVRATAPRPSIGEFAIVVLGFASATALTVWSFMNMMRNTMRNLKKANLQSTVEETLKELSAELE
jgi:hypothetical protein